MRVIPSYLIPVNYLLQYVMNSWYYQSMVGVQITCMTPVGYVKRDQDTTLAILAG
jgi:hypothetical protein